MFKISAPRLDIIFRKQKEEVEMKKIDVEAHFYTKEYQEYLLLRKEAPREELHNGYLRLWYGPKSGSRTEGKSKTA